MKQMIPIPTIKRFPSYLRILEEEEKKGAEYVSTTTLADALDLKPIQVRKDISSTGINGKPKVGFPVKELSEAINHALGWDNVNSAIIVGAGNLGRALSGYEGFNAYGLSVAAIFDNDEKKIGEQVSGLTIRDIREVRDYIKDNHIGIAVITVPASVSQETADYLVDCGVRGIWNFAPKDLKVPEGVVLQRTDLATSLAVLSAKLRNSISSHQDETI